MYKFQDTGRYYLATRGVLELEQYILDMYQGSAVKCEMCKKVCVQVKNYNCISLNFSDT